MFAGLKSLWAVPRFRRQVLVREVLWTLGIGAFIALSHLLSTKETANLGLVRAQEGFRRDVLLRHWTTERGGVYVPLDALTPANPYLVETPDREITTSKGKVDTLVNPAYLTRMLHEQGDKVAGTRGHITSLKPLNPSSAPDAWERKALQAFESGAREFWEEAPLEGRPHLRYMGALVTDQGCLACHARQGYRVGDIRGGISISVPLDRNGALGALAHDTLVMGGLGLIWLLGGWVILALGLRDLHRHQLRAEAEAELRALRDRLETVVESAEVATWEWNVQTGETTVNRAWATMLGYTLEELEPISVKTWEAVCHPEDLLEVRAASEAHFRGEEPGYELECRLRHKDGRWVWVLDRGRLSSRTEDGRPLMMVGIRLDITRRKQDQEALLALQIRLQAIIDSAQAAVWEWNVQTGEAAIGERWAALLGYTLAELPPISQKTWAGLCHPEDLPKAQAAARAHLRGKAPTYEVEYRMRHKDGHWVWLLDRGRILSRTEDGRPLLMSGLNLDISRRKQDEEALRKLSAAVEQSPVCILITDHEGAIEYANARFTQLTGYTLEEARGRNPRFLGSGLAPPGFHEELWARLNRGGTWEGQFCNRNKQGELFWEQAVISPLRNAQGQVTHFLALKEDITARKHAEDTLRRNEARLTQILEATHVGTWEWNLQTGEVAIDDRYAEMLGYGRADLEPMSFQRWSQLIHPEDRERNLPKMERHLAGEMPFFDAEVRMLHRDGSWVWILDRGSVTEWTADGRPLRMFGTHIDVTPRKADEAQLAESEQRLAWALGVTGEGMWDWDIPSDRVTHNQQWGRLLGLGEDFLCNSLNGFKALVHPEDRAAVEQRVWEALGPGAGLYRSEHRLVRADGSAIWVMDRGQVVTRDAEGRALRMVGCYADITPVREAQARLVELNLSLELRVMEEVARNQEQSRVVEQQARLAAMGEMVGAIAHQWRQPLNALSIILANLQDAGRFGDLTPEYLEESATKGGRLIQKMSTTIDDFRGFLKPDKARQAFPVRAQVQEAIALVESGYWYDGIEVVFQAAGDPWIWGVPGEFSQVLLNLLGNAREAIRALGQGRGRIWIRVADDGQGGCRVAVSDDGGGIKVEPLERVFEPYFTTKAEGTGLGLYMSQRIAVNMGGHLEVCNIPGGAEISLVVPLAETPHGPDPA